MKRTELPRSAVHRIACAVVATEVRRIREKAMPATLDGLWSEAMRVGEEGLELDSMEQLGALGALAETFNLDDSLLNDAPADTVGEWIDWIMAGQATAMTSVTVSTSGSTGTPRRCVHAASTLVEEAAFLAEQFGDRRRVVAMVPADHLYGLIWGVLLPGMMNIPVVVRTLGAPLGLLAGDLVVAVPDQWRAISQLTRRFPEDVVGISSAGYLDGSIGERVLTTGLARFVDVYGASETGAIAIRQVPEMSYDLLPKWRLSPLESGDWQLMDGDGVTAPLPDYIDRIGERSLRLLGRRDGAVQVAGHNVWPECVAGILRQVDGVAEAAVRLNTTGRLKAFIVPNVGHNQADLARVLETIVAQLPVHERLKSFRFGASLPRSGMGKLEDWG